jgi:uncharacterized protein YbbC (DUF1343 family)
MTLRRLTFALLLLLPAPALAQVLPGADLLLGDSLHLVAHRRVGVLCHRASLLANGTHLLDTLAAAGVDVRIIFTPEHGFDASAPAGAHVASGRRGTTPVHSLYGTRRAPDSAALAAIDVLVCDLQDVGARYYTYVSTLAHVMRTAAAARLPVVVLDRPNPINGVDIEGPLLDTARTSFVGMFPIPIRHGMTIGELARMITGEAWLGEGAVVDLRVLPLRGWRRAMYYDETGLAWSRPSPNIPTLETAILYPGTCLVEGTNLSEGRGTDAPFHLVGAPFVDTVRCAALLRDLAVPGLRVTFARFTPRSLPAAPEPKWKDAACTGLAIEITDRRVLQPVRAAWTMLATVRACAPSMKLVAMFERLAGMRDGAGRLDRVRLDEEFARWSHDEALFARARVPYLLY